MTKTTTVKQGDSIRRRVALTYIGTTTPVDLTGCTAKSQMRIVPGGELKAEATVTIDAANGSVTALFSAEQTAELDAGSYGFDIRLMSEGDVKTLHTEQVKIVDPYTDLEEA